MTACAHVRAHAESGRGGALGLGSTAGRGAARVAASHYSVMVRDTSQMFVAGPPVVARIGQRLEKNELGGSHIHTRNGAVDDEVNSEAEAFERARRFLSYLPSSVYGLPPRADNTGKDADDPARREEWLIEAIPRNRRQVYHIRNIVEAVVDAGSFLEIGRGWGRPVITGLARLDGWPVALMASDPYHYGGAWTADAARKITRFVDLADTFHLPMVHLVDIPGFLIGLAAERAGTLRHGAAALAAIFRAEIPWCSGILPQAFGAAGMGQQNGERDGRDETGRGRTRGGAGGPVALARRDCSVKAQIGSHCQFGFHEAAVLGYLHVGAGRADRAGKVVFEPGHPGAVGAQRLSLE